MPTIIHAYYRFQLSRRRHQARSAVTNSNISQSKTPDILTGNSDIITVPHIHTQPFYDSFSGTTRVSRCQKTSPSGLHGARDDNRGRHTANPARSHSIRTNQRPTSIIPSFLRQMPFLPQPSQFILAWDRHQIWWFASQWLG